MPALPQAAAVPAGALPLCRAAAALPRTKILLQVSARKKRLKVGSLALCQVAEGAKAAPAQDTALEPPKLLMEALRAGLRNLSAPAIIADGVTTSYWDLLRSSLRVCQLLQRHHGAPQPSSEPGPRVAIMADPGPAYVAGTMGSWMHRGIAVPLCLSHPDRALQYVLDDAGVSSVLATERHAERLYKLAQPLGASVMVLDPLMTPSTSSSSSTSGSAGSNGSGGSGWGGERSAAGAAAMRAIGALAAERLRGEVIEQLARVRQADGALIIYTSGTTGNPKGVLHTHRSVTAQVRSLCEAWEWAPSDRVLHSLPLHHVHGVVNALYCALYCGAAVEFLPQFSPGEAWRRLMRQEDPITVFMGVPTMYSFLLHKYEEMAPEGQAEARAAAARLRLTVSGSSACPLPVMAQWEAVSGQRLLERYGMTETGMILGNPYSGERRPGSVGQPFPGVEVKLVGKPGDPPGVGEVHVKGEQLFSHYWQKPEATREAFDEQGYFITGDIAELSGSPPYYSLLGRSSVDIIKHGGYKLSALQIESVLLEHPGLKECAVVGVPDKDYGEAVCLLAVFKPGSPALDLKALRGWAQDKLAKYQMPTRLVGLEALPRNAMGKVNKKDLRKLVPPQQGQH